MSAVDCGTNSIRLLVADVDRSSGEVVDVVRRMEVVRLGSGVDRTGVIAPEAMARTLAAASAYAEQCALVGAERVRFVATSATRDARNSGEFVEGVRRAFGSFDVVPEVLSGVEEAALSFRGATAELPPRGIEGPYLVVDLGGGSTELVRGSTAVEASSSLDIGCVRMTERHLHSDPPTQAEIAAAVHDIDAALDAGFEHVPLDGVRSLVGLAGSVTTVAAHALRLPAYDSSVIHLSQLPVPAILTAAAELLHMDRRARAALLFMHPGRVDVIGAGALVWSRVVERVAVVAGVEDVLASEHDILDGIALSVA